MKDVALVIVSCDAYKDTWPYFFACFTKFWPDCYIKKYIVTNELAPTYNDINVILSGEEKSWSSKMRYALGQISEDIIILLLDDYFICKKVENNEIEKTIERFIEYQYDYLRLMPIPKVSKKRNGIYELDGKNLYEINLQASVWRKSYLLRVLRHDGLSAWQVEAMQKVSSPYRIMGNVAASNYPIIDYLNGIIQGKWYPSTVKKMKKLNIFINTSQRGIMSFKAILTRNIKIFIMHNINIPIVVRLKNILKFFGFKFVTEN